MKYGSNFALLFLYDKITLVLGDFLFFIIIIIIILEVNGLYLNLSTLIYTSEILHWSCSVLVPSITVNILNMPISSLIYYTSQQLN
jgi:hypothetical protein